MLKYLRIQDMILIESLQIPFEAGFNVLSGETGSGKSALMTALALILGKRAESNILRKGVTKGKVEGIFDTSPTVSKMLDEYGITSSDELIIRREIFNSGKSRAFINDQPVTLTLLKQIGEYLVKFVGQHANQQLLSIDTHRELLDRYGESAVEPFSNCFHELCNLEKKLKSLQQNEATKQKEIEICRLEIEEITSIDCKTNEDDHLFAEYTILTQAEEFQEKCHELTQALSGDTSITSHLNGLKHTFEELLKIDPSLNEHYQTYQQSIIELQEISHVLTRSMTSHEYCPSRLSQVNDRLSELHKLKRKYGKTLDDVMAYCEEQKEHLDHLENGDLHIEALEKEILKKKKECDTHAKKLTAERQKAAQHLESEIMHHFKALNMSRAQFHVTLIPSPRTQFGDEKIEFFMSPNIGEKRVSVTECASGGELARLMLSFQVLLAGKEEIPCIVFDEIDANIGGTTAVSVGAKLKEIGSKHQVLCITHFPQVASQADFHLQISKEEIDGRTLTLVQTLDDELRKRELERMHGLVPL
ncbi:MAG: DNA repair protein RecN [Chlamydiae bacterium]|nr:DNA repair protein RecN [Chlamydiota bacterium]